MIFGFNTDVQGVDGVYHVQTEDRGSRNPVIESIVYLGGKILGKKRTPYVPANWSQEKIAESVRLQHKELIEAVKAGTWASLVAVPKPEQAAAPAHPASSKETSIEVKLTNPDSFHHGEYFRFQLSLLPEERNGGNERVGVEARWLVDGTVSDQQSLTAREDGTAEIWVPASEIGQCGELLVKAHSSRGSTLAKFMIKPVA